MFDLKTGAGVLAVVLTLAGYFPYLRDVVRGKTQPHVFSWFLWTFVTAIVFALQWSGGAGLGALITLTVVVMCGLVLVLGLRSKHQVEITFSDKIFLGLALTAVMIWLVAKQPVLSIILATTIDLLGFAPTLRKSWHKPYSETLSFYVITAIRFVLAIVALREYSVLTALYPITWMLGNGLFAMLLVVRRQVVKPPQN